MHAFDDCQTATISEAFDRAWDRYLLTGALAPGELAEVREMLACRILLQARLGEWDAWRMGRDAFVHVWRFKHMGQPPPAGVRAIAGQDSRRTKPSKLRTGSFRHPNHSRSAGPAKVERA
jgi:hypothetical protein